LAVLMLVLSKRFNGHNTAPYDTQRRIVAQARWGASTVLTHKCEIDMAKLGGFAPEILDKGVLRLDRNDRIEKCCSLDRGRGSGLVLSSL
jgi:hypothetical protein